MCILWLVNFKEFPCLFGINQSSSLFDLKASTKELVNSKIVSIDIFP